jgi:hypothetical protein
MEPDRRQKIGLAVLIVLLTGGALYWLGSGPAAVAPTASNQRVATRGQAGSTAITAPDVHLEALRSERPRPDGMNRNLFRFKPKPPPVAARPAGAGAERPAGPVGPPPPPPVPPIALKFMGVLESPERSLRVAMLSDGRGIYSGREGDIIEGRYRIVRIGTESIEMTHLDGSGRQVIRLSGS